MGMIFRIISRLNIFHEKNALAFYISLLIANLSLIVLATVEIRELRVHHHAISNEVRSGVPESDPPATNSPAVSSKEFEALLDKRFEVSDSLVT